MKFSILLPTLLLLACSGPGGSDDPIPSAPKVLKANQTSFNTVSLKLEDVFFWPALKDATINDAPFTGDIDLSGDILTLVDDEDSPVFHHGTNHIKINWSHDLESVGEIDLDILPPQVTAIKVARHELIIEFDEVSQNPAVVSIYEPESEVTFGPMEIDLYMGNKVRVKLADLPIPDTVKMTLEVTNLKDTLGNSGRSKQNFSFGHRDLEPQFNLSHIPPNLVVLESNKSLREVNPDEIEGFSLNFESVTSSPNGMVTTFTLKEGADWIANLTEPMLSGVFRDYFDQEIEYTHAIPLDVAGPSVIHLSQIEPGQFRVRFDEEPKAISGVMVDGQETDDYSLLATDDAFELILKLENFNSVLSSGSFEIGFSASDAFGNVSDYAKMLALSADGKPSILVAVRQLERSSFEMTFAESINIRSHKLDIQLNGNKQYIIDRRKIEEGVYQFDISLGYQHHGLNTIRVQGSTAADEVFDAEIEVELDFEGPTFGSFRQWTTHAFSIEGSCDDIHSVTIAGFFGPRFDTMLECKDSQIIVTPNDLSILNDIRIYVRAYDLLGNSTEQSYRLSWDSVPPALKDIRYISKNGLVVEFSEPVLLTGGVIIDGVTLPNSAYRLFHDLLRIDWPLTSGDHQIQFPKLRDYSVNIDHIIDITTNFAQEVDTTHPYLISKVKRVVYGKYQYFFSKPLVNFDPLLVTINGKPAGDVITHTWLNDEQTAFQIDFLDATLFVDSPTQLVEFNVVGQQGLDGTIQHEADMAGGPIKVEDIYFSKPNRISLEFDRVLRGSNSVAYLIDGDKTYGSSLRAAHGGYGVSLTFQDSITSIVANESILKFEGIQGRLWTKEMPTITFKCNQSLCEVLKLEY